MAGDTVDIDEASLQEIYAAISEDPAVIAAKMELATRAQDYARSIAPSQTGAYRDSINARRGGNTVWVGFEDEQAHIIEYGSVDTPEFAIRAKTEEHINNDG